MNPRWMQGLVASGCVWLGASLASGADYPTRPIRLIVGFPPGAQSDSVARLIGGELSTLLRQPVVIDNRGGASGAIGAELAARAPADGYTLLLGSITNLAIAPLVIPHLGYDSLRDFAAIRRFARVPLVVAVNSKIPVTTLGELVDYARTHPGELTCATGAPSTQLAIQMLMNFSATDILHVPYKGTAAAAADVASGHVSLTIADLAALAPHAQSGRIRLLATTSPKRLRAAADLPTAIEQGFTGDAVFIWQAIVVPRDTPADVVATLRSALFKVVSAPGFSEQLERMGFEAVEEDPAEFPAMLKAEIERFRPMVKQAGIGADPP
jgi:tripartite-type tricarboxylate transporter receptor subunit TctC